MVNLIWPIRRRSTTRLVNLIWPIRSRSARIAANTCVGPDQLAWLDEGAPDVGPDSNAWLDEGELVGPNQDAWLDGGEQVDFSLVAVLARILGAVSVAACECRLAPDSSML